MWVTTTDLPKAASHPFYRRLNELLREHGFDNFAEAQCASFYAETIGRPSLAPGIYFRLLLIGYVEGLDSERGIAWRVADSLALRDFLGVGLEDDPPAVAAVTDEPVAMIEEVVGKRLLRRRGELLERPCAHLYETGALQGRLVAFVGVLSTTRSPSDGARPCFQRRWDDRRMSFSPVRENGTCTTGS